MFDQDLNVACLGIKDVKALKELTCCKENINFIIVSGFWHLSFYTLRTCDACSRHRHSLFCNEEADVFTKFFLVDRGSVPVNGTDFRGTISRVPRKGDGGVTSLREFSEKFCNCAAADRRGRPGWETGGKKLTQIPESDPILLRQTASVRPFLGTCPRSLSPEPTCFSGSGGGGREEPRHHYHDHTHTHTHGAFL